MTQTHIGSATNRHRKPEGVTMELHDVPEPWDEFTVWEVTILRHLLLPASYEQIAYAYGKRPSAIRKRVSEMMKPFCCKCSRELTTLAAQDGIQPLPLPSNN